MATETNASDKSIELASNDTQQQQEEEEEEQEEERKEDVLINVADNNNNDDNKNFVDSVADVPFEKSLIHKKIEKDVHNILDENVGWRLKDQLYVTIRRIKKKYPDMSDNDMMNIFDIDHSDLYNAYNNESALKDEHLKHAIRRDSDIKLIKKRYPLPVFSNKTWNLITKTDGFLFWELIFEFALLPIFLFFQTFFIFCYLIRNQLPVSGTTDLVLKDHFKVNIQSKREKGRRGSDAELSDFYTLPRGYAVKDLICNKERPSQTSCADFWCCCCRGIAIADYVSALNEYNKTKEKQKLSLRIAQRQQLLRRHHREEDKNDEEKDKDLIDELHKVDSGRSKLLNNRTCCAKKTCCCLCPTSWQMAPLLDVKKDNKARVNNIYWTPGWFNNCTPFDMLSWCFSTEKELDLHYAELRLIGNVSQFRTQCVGEFKLNDPRLILLFRLFLCICLTVMYCLLWLNGIECGIYFMFDTNIFYDLSGSTYSTDCIMEGILPILIFAITAFIISFWASFRAKIKLPNISKLSRFKIHWYDFTNVTQEEMMQETVKFTTFMNSQTGDKSESKLLKQIENATTSAKQFIQQREEVFRERIKKRVKHSRILRFRHDFDYALSVRGCISFIIAILPTIYKLCDKRLKIDQYDKLFLITSFILNFLTFLLFFSFIHHQIFATDKLDLFSFILNDITTIIEWPTVKDEDNENEKKRVKVRKENSSKFGFVTARMDKFKTTTDIADISDNIISSMDSSSLPYCNVLEHGNALSWVEMRSFLQGMIKSLLSKLDMLLAVIIILLFLTTSIIIYLCINHDYLGNQPVFINAIIVGCIVIIYLLIFNLIPLVEHGPKLRRLQGKQISGLEKQKLMATNIVNNSVYFDQFRHKSGGLWDDKLKKFAGDLGIGFLNTSIQVIKSGDFTKEGILGMVSKNLFLKSMGVLAAAAFPTVVTSVF